MAAGRTRTTWSKGQGGKPLGAKDTVPRSFKATVKAVYEQILTTNPQVIKDAVLRGLQARRPKEAFPYVKLFADLNGELKQHLELTGALQVDGDVIRDVRAELDRLAARAAASGASAADVAE